MRFAAGGRLLRAESVRGTGTALRAETVRLRERRVLRFAAGGGFSGWRGCAGRGLRCAWEQFGCGCDGVRFAAGEGFSRWRGRRRSRDGDCVARRNGSVAGAMGVHFAAEGRFLQAKRTEAKPGRGLRCAREQFGCESDGCAFRRGGRFLRAGSAEAEQETGIVLRAGTVRLRERRACVSLRGSFFGRRVCAVAERKCKAVYGYALESFGRGSGGRVFDAGGFSCARGRCARRKTSAMAAALFLKIPLRHEGVRSCGKETT